MSEVWLTAAFIAQIALFGAAGTMFVRAHLSRRRLDEDEAAALTASERYRGFSARGRASPPTQARANGLRRVGMLMLYGLLFLAGALAISALTTVFAAG